MTSSPRVQPIFTRTLKLCNRAAENDYVAALVAKISDLSQVTNAEGVLLLIDGTCNSSGIVPDQSAIFGLAGWMDLRLRQKLFSSRRLQDEAGWASAIQNVASGFLAIRISDVRQSYVMWFRAEIVCMVRWAVQPGKNHDRQGGLHPRASFAIWQELVHGQSAPWTEMEIESAQKFRAAVMTISLKRAEESIELSEARFHADRTRRCEVGDDATTGVLFPFSLYPGKSGTLCENRQCRCPSDPL